MDISNRNSNSNSNSYPKSSYAVSGKIMLSAIIVLFTVVIAMVFLHLYARWYLQRARLRHNLRRLNRSRTNTSSNHLVFFNNPNGAALPTGSNRGLDASVLKSLPVFVYGSEESKEMMMVVVECAVCLSEFEDHEMMRCLPKCNHCFHIGCIDMWFHSHSTCPLCRSPVESDHFQSSSTDTGSVDVAAEVAVTVNESVVDATTTTDGISSSSSGFCSSCRHDEGETNRVRSSSSSSSSMFGMRRKPSLVLPIEVPRRSDDDFKADSPSSASQSYKSPVGRIRSFRRMISRGIPSPSSGAETSCGPSELDIELGKDRLTPRSRVDTPR